MTVIQIPDDQAAALKLRAAAQGLSLEDWLKKLAGMELANRRQESRYRLSDLMAQCDVTAPLSQEDREWIESPNVGREAL